MSDGTISPVPPAYATPVKTVDDAAVKILSLPPDLPLNTLINGEVVASKNGQITVQTKEGTVLLETDVPVPVGQKIELKIQNKIQDNVPVRSVALSAPQVADKVIIPVNNTPQAFAPLQARLVSLPQNLPDEALPVLINSLLKLPPQDPLPPLMHEGLEKFRQMTNLLTQANLLPAQITQKETPNSLMPQNVIPTLQQLLVQVKDNPLLSGPAQDFVQLQTILPGQKISPDILLNVRQQLMTILQTPAASPVPVSAPAGTAEKSLLPSLHTLIENFIHPQSQSIPQNAAGQEAKPLFTMPAIGLVLALSQSTASEIKEQSLVLLATPQAQQLVGLLSPQAKPAENVILPGTILIMAFKPQTEQAISMPLLPAQGLQGIKETLLPLHPALGDEWPVLDELWDEAMAQKNIQPEVLASLRQTLPAPVAQQMPPAFLFFLSVLKNDFAPLWLNEKQIGKLQKVDKDSLLKQLTDDLRGIQSRNDDNIPADTWKPLPMPLQVGDQLLRLQWFYRHPQEDAANSSPEEKPEQKKKKTRFLLDVPKTDLGDIQIDGLVAEKNLELILRTENPLLSHSEAIIRTRYQNVLETTGMQGGINFQAGRMHYVRV